jgi:predicted nucleic acid-binding protein
VTSIALFASFARTRISAPYFFLWRPSLPDPKDDFILELAVESRADFLLTFNSKDFAGADSFGVRVISPRPREFLAIIGETP